MRAFTVCVEYSDILEMTIARNRHHFDDWIIVTSIEDQRTISLVQSSGLGLLTTEAFYDRGADFNKWAGLNKALELYARYHGFVVILDADVVWPAVVDRSQFLPGRLYTPKRRMCKSIESIPDESEWSKFHRPDEEFAGYTQIFHSSDRHFSRLFEECWRHAGGADTEFQNRWDPSLKVRPNFEVLHLGEDGKNWYGRQTPLRDGTILGAAQERAEKVSMMHRNRQGKPRHSRYDSEKLR